jgi:quinol monooxygenase YgiN
MHFVRHYIMDARPGETERLRTTLMSLRDAVSAYPGSLHVDLLQTLASRERFIFIEHWDSKESHAEAGKRLPADLMNSLKSTLAGPPQTTDLTAIEAD